MSKFYCGSIKNNVRIQGNSNTGPRVLPCCVYQTDSNYSTLEQYQTSEEYLQLTQATVWPKGCNNCQQQELANQTSYRQLANITWPDETKSYPLRVELFPSNICNLKCFMCDADYSTALAQERKVIGISQSGPREFDITNVCLNELEKITNLDSVSLIGGEFFLTKGNLDILDWVIQRQAGLRIVTNATVILANHLDKLKQIKNLELQISVDGYQDSYEFMRYPATWASVSNNISRLITALPEADINFHYVVQALNVQHLIPTLDYCNLQRKSTRITNLVFPQHLTWTVLTAAERTSIVQLLEQQKTEYRITAKQQAYVDNLCKTITDSAYSDADRQKFCSFVGKTVKHRQLSAGAVNTHFNVLSNLSNQVLNT